MSNTQHNDIQKRKKELSRWLNYASIMVAGTATVITLLIPLGDLVTVRPHDTECSTQEVCAKIVLLESFQRDLELRLDQMMPLDTSKANTSSAIISSIELKQYQLELNEPYTSIQNLERVILDNPEKAVSIPLIKQEMANLRDQNAKEFKYTKDDIARVYDINKWIIGLVFGMLVSIIILNISNLLKSRKE